MQFAFEAMRADGGTVTDCLEAGTRHEAVAALRDKGLVVLRLDESAAAERRPALGRTFQRGRFTTRDRILFTRQMKMLLEAGAPVVPSLQAIREQTTKPTVRELLARLQERVEGGDSLAKALESERQHFDPVFRSMVAAGEATASLPDTFGRLSLLAQQQHATRKMVVGALIYPIVLCVLLTGVVNILLFFVVPRFRMLFLNLRSPLPATTKMLFALSEWLKHGWPYVVAVIAVLAAAIVVALRAPGTRVWLDETLVRLPVVGRLVSRLIFARIVRVWAAMLRCHVPLLDTIRQSREAVRNSAFLRLLGEIEESVAGGGRVGQAIASTQLAEPVIASAIRTGEENGRLAEAVDFVSEWMDEDNTTLVQHVTRLAEPVLLAFMGVVVGFVAMSLFVPLFDLATAGG